MNKLSLIPDSAGYSALEYHGVDDSGVEGPALNMRRSFLNNAAKVLVHWTLNGSEYDYIRSVYRSSESDGNPPFLIDLILDDPTLQEYVAKFSRDGVRLVSQSGSVFEVEADLLVVTKAGAPSMPDYPVFPVKPVDEFDPEFANVIGLFHFDDGDNVGIQFEDNSPFVGTQIAVAGLQTSASDPAFGLSSLRRPAGNTSAGYSSDVLLYVEKTVSLIANAPLTLECLAKAPSAVGSTSLIRVFLYNGASFVADFSIEWRGTGGGSTWSCSRNGTTLRTSFVDAPPHGGYRNIAFSLTPGGNGYFFVDGAQQGAAIAITSHGAVDKATITFHNSDVFAAAGAVLMDEARITVAHRYSSDFVIRSSPFPNK